MTRPSLRLLSLAERLIFPKVGHLHQGLWEVLLPKAQASKGDTYSPSGRSG